tara:strand:- start:4839 stop:5942 length:1104 start_codon:yes stop_codon:yes gene_type:complete
MKNEVSKMLDRQIIKTVPYQEFMTWELAEKWADEIPRFSENDPNDPEWNATPVIPLDLTSEGYGVLYVKDESVNPTGTHKDRPAWEITAAYRDFAELLLLQRNAIDIEVISVPRVTIMTAGNEGNALARQFDKYALPPVKILIDTTTPQEREEYLKSLAIELYKTDWADRPLSPEDIRTLTDNTNGIDLTSIVGLRPQEIFYDWLVHEAFNQDPDEIYMADGSGRLKENFLTWQEKNVRLYLANKRADPRLKISLPKLVNISVLGAEPERPDSQADKVVAPYKPFRVLDRHDISGLKHFSFTGARTGSHKVKERYITQAHRTFDRHSIMAEPSGAIGLALYMQMVDEKEVNPLDGRMRLMINTGKGI